jgi:cellulose synthase/poly-beta-1,6-N-acetylglucosamine synthase-like glycosyltransferase
MMEVLFWLAVGGVAYAYFGYPALLLLLGRRRKPLLRMDIPWPRVSVVITAHNESAQLADKIRNTLGWDYAGEHPEVIVASDGSTDDTPAIARSFAGEGVRLIHTGERQGKEYAQRQALSLASGEVIVFTDSGTRADRHALEALVRPFADPAVGCVTSTDGHRGSAPAGGEGWYLRYEMRLRELEARAGSVVGLSGSLFAVRRRVCDGWSDRTPSDFHLLLQGVRMGMRGVTAPEAVGFYAPVQAEKREFGRKVRTILRGMTALWDSRDLFNPFRYGRFAWQLFSHKVCRWLVPFWLLAALGLSLALAIAGVRPPVYAPVVAAQALFYGLALAGFGGGFRTLLVRAPFWFCLFNLSILKAWVLFVRGTRIVSWEPTRREAAR